MRVDCGLGGGDIVVGRSCLGVTGIVMEITPMMTGKLLPCIVMTGHSLFLIVCCVLLLVKAA